MSSPVDRGAAPGSPAETTDPRRAIPRTDRLLADPRLTAVLARNGQSAVKAAVVTAQEQARAGLLAPEGILEAALRALAVPASSLRRVLNATGVVVHTNLGRAPLSDVAVEAVREAAGHVDVEWDHRDGSRSRRGRGAIAALLDAVPGAADAHIVNNGAAAVVLVATALAAGREIIISRGELVEIGDGFRLPDLIVSTGARIREVGTTNRTTLADYEAALGPDTGFVLKIHPSNFVVRGFTSGVPIEALAGLPVPVVADIGSGLLRPLPLLPEEPDAASALAAGASLVTASGDKLLGGPQAGLLLGDAGVVALSRRHPLARALRVDKLTLAALEATLRGPATPVEVALHASLQQLTDRAVRLADRLEAAGCAAEVVASTGLVGGGGAPGVELPGAAVALDAALAAPLRAGDPRVASRVEQDRCLLDLRAVPPASDDELYAAVLAAAGAHGSQVQ